MNTKIIITFDEFKRIAETFPRNYILNNTEDIDTYALGVIDIDENGKKIFTPVHFTVGAINATKTIKPINC